MTITTRLEKLDLDSLDLIERQMYNSTIGFCSKSESLQMIIDGTDGNFCQLSDALQEIAIEQFDEL